MSYTPGPWSVQHGPNVPIVRRITMPHGEAPTYSATVKHGFNFVCKLDFGYGQPCDEANARLIAAAPELLTACKAALNDRMYKDWPGVADLLIAAIAKAEAEGGR